jgi:glycosyltransferase involved in cell wall biosynthesis
MRVTVMIPTQRRPHGLSVAVRSVFAQDGVDFAALELIVVDNDQVASAQAAVAELADEAPFPIHYVHEPRPGVAHARNAGMAKASGELIAFLDDDEEAPAGWLAALLAAQARYNADVVFGPVRARAPAGLNAHRDYLERFFRAKGSPRPGSSTNITAAATACCAAPPCPIRSRRSPWSATTSAARTTCCLATCRLAARASPGSRRPGSGKIPCPTA